MDSELEEFLRGRKVKEDVIERMKEQKIDRDVIGSMSKDDLRPYLTLGDTIAIREFCKGRNASCSSPRESLIEKLRRKIGKNNNGRGPDDPSDAGNATATPVKRKKSVKTTRIIEIGWLMDGHQLRSSHGGGTRKIQVPKGYMKGDILKIAIDLFFPDGNSPNGVIDNFEADVLDFKRNEFNDDLSVSDLYEITGLSTLRFYLSTQKKAVYEEIFPENPQLNTDNDDIILISGDEVHTATGDIESNRSASVFRGEDLNHLLSFHHSGMQWSHTEISGNRGTTMDASSVEVDVASLPPETFKVTLHRGHIYEELLQAMEAKDFSTSHVTLEIEILLPNGEKEAAFDAGGVMKDALTEFWETFYETKCVGSGIKIPCIRHDYNDHRWKTVARILLIGYVQTGVFPNKLARPFVEYSIFGCPCSQLLGPLLEYIGPSDAITLRNALDCFENVPMEEIIDILQNLECKLIITKENFETILRDIAHKEMIQKPMYIIDSFYSILNQKISIETVQKIYETRKVTNRNVLKLVQTQSPLSVEQDNVYKFLTRFLREAELHTLENFLRFCTGANTITTEKIEVTYNSNSGIKRSPIAHTCANTLELPTTYDIYTDFKSEFKNILTSGVWVMDII